VATDYVKIVSKHFLPKVLYKNKFRRNYGNFHRLHILYSGSGACPECEIPLRRGNFKLQLFEDASIDKEVEIRRRILKDFCKTRDDFATLHDYNDYLELIEDIIFNLANNIDVEDTKRRIQNYKEANKEFISKNRNRIATDRLELEDILAEEKRVEAKRKQEDALVEVESKTAKVRNKEKLIDDLMFSDTDARYRTFLTSSPIRDKVNVLYLPSFSQISELLLKNTKRQQNSLMCLS
jgi:CDK-activating kinase assembly factor MAT1